MDVRGAAIPDRSIAFYDAWASSSGGRCRSETKASTTVDDLDATLTALEKKGIEPERPPYTVREGGSRICFVRDPDGYRVELIEGG
jgi:catechol 2,3-dioxygenase-like lactoylglutathione lyase family enzyme